MKNLYYAFRSIIRWNNGNSCEDVDQLLYCETWLWPGEKQNLLRRALGLPEIGMEYFPELWDDPGIQRELWGEANFA